MKSGGGGSLTIRPLHTQIATCFGLVVECRHGQSTQTNTKAAAKRTAQPQNGMRGPEFEENGTKMKKVGGVYI